MFRGKAFYHSHIRKAIIAFGSIFNNINVTQTDDAGETVKILNVPLSYGPKQKFIARIAAAPTLETGRTPFEIVLPRIGFEIISLAYDPSRKLLPTQTVRSVETAGAVRTSYVDTPYNMGIKLVVFAKNQDDGLQIIEQILPFFNPDFCVSVKQLPDLGIMRDLMVVLDSISYSDDYEGDFSTRTTIMWEFNFTIKLNLFGYVDDASLIKKTIIDLYADNGLLNGVPSNTYVGERITTVPDPLDADPSGPYQYIQDFDAIFTG
jgi:hypothetical protein